jgi:hypothetical protein
MASYIKKVAKNRTVNEIINLKRKQPQILREILDMCMAYSIPNGEKIMKETVPVSCCNQG